MKIVSLFIAICFSLNVMAASGTIQELERHMDEYQYALTVDWDQKDEAFYDQQTKVFFEKMESLIKAGLTQKDLQLLISKRVNNSKAIEALKLKVNLLAKDASADELVKVVKDATKEMYSQGASWNGYTVVPVIVGGLILAALAYSYWWDAKHECVAYENQYVCNTYNTCNGQVYYGSTYYSGSSCVNFPQTVCDYQDVCIEYAEKD